MPEHRLVDAGGERAPLLPLSPSMRWRAQAGFNLVELVLTMAVLVLVAVLGLPALFNASAEQRVKLAAHEVAGVLTEARWQALKYATRVGVKFYPEEDATFFRIYRDGDGDGVRTKDIERGIDPPLGPMRRLDRVGRFVTLGFPPGADMPAPGASGGSLGDLSDPIRFNRSDIASFTGIGGATPGTIYLTDRRSKLAAVRVYNRTGKLVVVQWDSRRKRWSR